VLVQEKREYWTIWLAALLFFAAFYTLMIPLPLYLAQAGLPDWQIGAILGALGVASLIARPLAGTFADGWGRKPVMLFGTVALVVGVVGISSVTRAPVLFGMRVAQAVGYVAFTTAATALVADLASPERRGGALALFGTAANIAMTLTPAAINAALDVLTLTGAFWLAAALAAIAGVMAFRVKEPAAEKAVDSHGNLFGVMRKLVTPVLAAALFGVGFGAFLQFLPLLAERRGIGAIGLVYSVYGIGIILTRLTTGRLLDGSSRNRMLSLAFLLLGAGLTGFAVAGSLIGLLVAALAIAAGSGVLHPSLIAIHVERVAPNERGRATAVFYLGFDLGIGLGAWILAPVFQWFGLTGLYLLAASAAIAGTIPTRFLAASDPSPQESRTIPVVQRG
jgi:MFS family permease